MTSAHKPHKCACTVCMRALGNGAHYRQTIGQGSCAKQGPWPYKPYILNTESNHVKQYMHLLIATLASCRNNGIIDIGRLARCPPIGSCSIVIQTRGPTPASIIKSKCLAVCGQIARSGA